MKNSLRSSLAGLAIATSAIVAPGCDKEDKEIDTTQVATEAGVKKLLQEIPPYTAPEYAIPPPEATPFSASEAISLFGHTGMLIFGPQARFPSEPRTIPVPVRSKAHQERNLHFGRIFDAIARGTKEPTLDFCRWHAMSGLRMQGKEMVIVLQYEQKNKLGPKSLFVYVNEVNMTVAGISYLNTATMAYRERPQSEIDFDNHMTTKYSGQVITSALLDEIGAATAPHIMNNGDMGNFKKE